MRKFPDELPNAGGLSTFARALWGLELRVSGLPAAANAFTPRRPRFLASELWLPTSPLVGVPGSFANYSLAALAHVAAHRRFGGARFLVKTLKPIQIAIISLLEDARVERLAALAYPGLSRLWAPFHQVRPSGAKTSGALLARLARALHDDALLDDDDWVSKGRALFLEHRESLHDPELSRRIGTFLGNDLGQMRVQFNAKDYLVEPPYRDDNTGLWQFALESDANGTELESDGARRREDDSLSATQGSAERARPSAQGTVIDSPELASPLPASLVPETTVQHPEWDYVIRCERPAFCTVRESIPHAERFAQQGDVAAREESTRRRLERSARRLASHQPVRERRLADGDRLELPAVIATVVAHKTQAAPDARVYRRVRFQPEPPALLLLLDLSESLNAVPLGASRTLVDLARNAAALLASTLSETTPNFAIHGFSSNGRHDVGYYRFKDFERPYDERARARLAGMQASRSTRLGTALRHAGRELETRSARRKLLLVVSDGEPSDVDVHDAEYLLGDAKQATFRNRQRGVRTFCIGLDPHAEPSVERIFGPGSYLLLAQHDSLPRKVSELYLRLSA